VLAAGDVAVAVHGRATVVAEPLAGAEGVAAVAIDVESIQPHGDPRFRIEGGVEWRWTDAEVARRDEAVHAALRGLAG
jgi:hypothetical protein